MSSKLVFMSQPVYTDPCREWRAFATSSMSFCLQMDGTSVRDLALATSLAPPNPVL